MIFSLDLLMKILVRVIKGRTARFRKLREARKILDGEVERPFKLYSQRKYEDRPDYSSSVWARMLLSDRIKDPSDRKGGKLFRRRFRVPYPLFLDVVKLTRDSGLFLEGCDCTGRAAAPLELKVLSVLRVLGRGYCFDGVEELTLISAEVLRMFFKKFCYWFARELFSKYCNPPETPEEIAISTNIYERLGLPGCVGSTDCVHVRWERCPAGIRSNHKGKEGYATLSYEVTVDHQKKIIAATIGHPGCRNDKTIVKFDGFVTAIHDGKIYKDVPFNMVDCKGVVREEKGLYLIVDGGYHKWKCLQCPIKHTSIPKNSLWSKWVESVRKDVECTFGILKGRFRCLKLPIYNHDKDTVDDMFFTCCILHNMLLTEDGYDKRWEENMNWSGQAGHHDASDIPSIFKRHYNRTKASLPTLDFSLMGINSVINQYAIVHSDVEEEIELTQEVLRNKLIEHFFYKYGKGKINWLS